MTHTFIQAKGDASELLAKKTQLTKTKADLQTEADARRVTLERKANSVGNIVHETVPISNTEVLFTISLINA